MHIDRLRLQSLVLAFGVLTAACAKEETVENDTGTSGTGGHSSTGGSTGAGGSGSGGSGSGGNGSGGSGSGGNGSGGSQGSGGQGATGGLPGSGGARGTGGVIAPRGTGGTGSGGTTGSDAGTGTDGSVSVNCNGTVPTGGTMHTGDTQGTAAGMSWSLWRNGSGGSITTYGVPAFSAAWASSGDFLARIGLQWGSGKAYTSLGTVAAQFAETKTGTAGGFSYVGIYGWSVNPCIEWYIVDDSYNKMPVNPGSTTNKGTVTIDGGTYTLYTRATTGTGGNRCGSSVTNWMQFYSVRQTARTCGQISITDHFNAWSAANMTLGAVLEASILIEAGGGTGNVDFTTANVTAK